MIVLLCYQSEYGATSGPTLLYIVPVLLGSFYLWRETEDTRLLRKGYWEEKDESNKEWYEYYCERKGNSDRRSLSAEQA
ncbi:hypothetical protein [Brevibacillus laterosporus]|uniref:Uncharacterized protein n=1 Tax=Brevibacillus laterosporus TaxID=1465 RepID=A0AAP3DEH5_BRELA|nr:hypothetical protein [Brevibacillus laterosporus]MCR8979001.1 hypothetical protein [Brevibacillus laterosporus]MCZ0806157.1 hypothetical protein [Brevibacillus laterosporus]MCZ0824603.1 hypothetical protein [Brevibacillus laterosporus]MCZ0848629.1 hypothetical protein [Brevibacillus laterosporus]